jgi:hypothetical protein
MIITLILLELESYYTSQVTLEWVSINILLIKVITLTILTNNSSISSTSSIKDEKMITQYLVNTVEYKDIILCILFVTN